MFSALPGAVLHERFGVPAHYGHPIREQRALAEGLACVSLEHHGVITVSGADRLSWLHSMLSQHVLGLPPHTSVETMLLDPNGRIVHVIRLVDDGDTTWLLVDADQAEPLAAYLLRMRFALRVDVVNRSDSHASVLVCGEPALTALRDTAAPVVAWHDPWAAGVAGGVQYAAQPHAGAQWNATHLVYLREQLPQLRDAVTAGTVHAAGTIALQALEVRAWRPNQTDELDERSIPHEFDWLRTAVHLNKGCYRGQETVAKVHNLGHPPRRLTLLHLDGSEGALPAAGDLVFRAGDATAEDARPVGRITRAVMHHEWGAIALALVKRSVAEDAALEVAVADAAAPLAAQQEIIVPANAGQTRVIPRLPRL